MRSSATGGAKARLFDLAAELWGLTITGIFLGDMFAGWETANQARMYLYPILLISTAVAVAVTLLRRYGGRNA